MNKPYGRIFAREDEFPMVKLHMTEEDIAAILCSTWWEQARKIAVVMTDCPKKSKATQRLEARFRRWAKEDTEALR